MTIAELRSNDSSGKLITATTPGFIRVFPRRVIDINIELAIWFQLNARYLGIAEGAD